MTSDNPTADRLVSDARKKTASLESPRLAQIGLVVGVLGVIAGVVSPICGWALGAAAVVLGVVSTQRNIAVKSARIGLVLGVASILVGTYSSTWMFTHGGVPWYQSF